MVQAATATEPKPAAAGDAHNPWRPYFQAALGFRNHWYPAFFGNQLAEGECRGQELLGERVLFKRIDGRVYDHALHGLDGTAQPVLRHEPHFL